jgi:HSP20 family protein
MRRRSFQIEQFERAGRYVVRAQVPGLDPKNEIGVMVADNEVTIEVRWPVRWPGPVDGAFHYEPVRRTVLLPRGAKDETLTASYDRGGILELSVELTRPAVIGRMVPVQLPTRIDADVRVSAKVG